MWELKHHLPVHSVTLSHFYLLNIKIKTTTKQHTKVHRYNFISLNTDKLHVIRLYEYENNDYLMQQ